MTEAPKGLRPVSEAPASGHLVVRRRGERIAGFGALRRIDGDEGRWLVVKTDEDAADARRNAVSTEPDSVARGRGPDAVAGGRGRVSEGGDIADLAAGPPESGPAEWMEPMLAVPTDRRSSHPDGIFERKLDGMRAMAFRDGARLRMTTRNRNDMSDAHRDQADVSLGQAARDIAADGAIVAFDGDVSEDANRVRPDRVARPGFAERTRAGRRGRPRFPGLRHDRAAEDVTREAPTP